MVAINWLNQSKDDSYLLVPLYSFILSLVEAQCTALENPNNGVVTTTGQRPGDLASYSCNEGYIIQGDDTRVCQNSGEWSGDAPTCTGK